MKFHSMVSEITNSSTTIYTVPMGNAPEVVRDLINAILEDAGSDKRFEDLYSTKITASDYANDCWLDYGRSDYIYDKFGDDIEYEKLTDEQKTQVEEGRQTFIDEGEWEGDKQITVLDKDGNDRVGILLSSIYTSYESYN